MADPQKDLPQSLEAEVSVLGAMLLDDDIVDSVVPLLRPEAFSRPAHADIYRAVLALHDGRHGVDLVTVGEALKKAGKLDATGGLQYLAQLVDAVPSAANAEHYAHIVREKHVQRDLMRIGQDILGRAQAGKEESRVLLDEAQRLLFEVAERGARRSVAEMKDLMERVFEKIDHWRDRGERLTGLETGFYDLDDITSGLQPSDFIVLAARPSMGKTSLALNIIEHVGVRSNLPVLIFSMEMSQEQIARNMLCTHGRINSHHLRRGTLSSEELERLGMAADRLSNAPIFIDDSPGLTIYEVRAKARRLRSQRNIELCVVDYIQLMEPPKADSREQQVAQISRGLKQLARELQIPVIGVAQLNRGVEQRDDHRPRTADLRESGAIEQDADVVLLLHRPSMYRRADADAEPDSGGGGDVAELHVAKQRNGPVGVVPLTFIKHCMRFESCTSPPRGEA